MIHAWAGLTLGSIILLSSITGTLLIWKEDYVLLRLPEMIKPFEPSPENLAAIGRAVESQFENNDIFQIQFATESFPYSKVILADTRYAYLDSDGVIVDLWQKNERFEEWLYDFHHRLLLENIGLTVLGFAAMALIVIVLMGVFVFWPLRGAFKRGVLPKSTARPQLLVSHRNIGVVITLPLLTILVTGVLMCFPETSEEWMLEPFRGENYSMDFSDNLDGISGGNSGEWLPTLQRALDAFPNSKIRTATVPSAISPYRVVGLQQPGELHPGGKSQIYIDAAGGWMDIRIDAHAQHISERVYNLSYPLHTGRMNSYLYKFVLTAVALIVVVLASLGMLSFLKNLFGSLPRHEAS